MEPLINGLISLSDPYLLLLLLCATIGGVIIGSPPSAFAASYSAWARSRGRIRADPKKMIVS